MKELACHVVDLFVPSTYVHTQYLFMFRQQSAAQSHDHYGEDAADGIQPPSSFLMWCTIFEEVPVCKGGVSVCNTC